MGKKLKLRLLHWFVNQWLKLNQRKRKIAATSLIFGQTAILGSGSFIAHDMATVMQSLWPIWVLTVVGFAIAAIDVSLWSAAVGLMADQAESIDDLLNLCNRDYLTGLYNERFFEEEGPRMEERARRENHQLALCYVDVDRFKDINDTYGHDVGDTALKNVADNLADAVASALSGAVRKGGDDLVARLHGDEFAALISAPDEESIGVVVERISSRIASFIFRDEEDRRVSVSSSIGVIIGDPKESGVFRRLKKEAEAIMRANKGKFR